MKNILVISSSLRRGNSSILCDEFIKGAKENNHNVSKIDIGDLNLKFCLGCSKCQETGVCVIKDDVKKVLDLFVSSDIVVFATPVYFGSIAGQLKVLLDRFYPLYQKVSNKEIYAIASCYQNDILHIENSLLTLRTFLFDLGNFKISKVIYGENCDEANDLSESQKLIAYNIGKSIK